MITYDVYREMTNRGTTTFRNSLGQTTGRRN
jgi:hypothetical protein